jgi:phosphocarrier protein HPr
MIQRKILIDNKLGIHARPAGMIVDITSRAASDVFISYEGTKANAKSILNVMMLAVEPGAEIEVQIEGDDEQQVLDKLIQLVKDKFHEEG